MHRIKKIMALAFTATLLTTWSQANEASLSKAYFAGGCFWGVEYYLEDQKGVKEVTSGFMGGRTKNPSYKEVVYTQTGHIETVEVLYDPALISYEALTKRFFEIHDFTQTDGQGPDIGDRYESYIFYSSKQEEATAKKLVAILTQKGYKVATKIRKASTFYKAESYHQDYYKRHKKVPYCHAYKKVF